MKRSTRVSLVLLTSVSAAAALSGCEPAPQTPADNGGTFANKAECVAVYDEATCEAADKLAQREHLQNAPKFNDRQACIEQFGADMCRPASMYGGSSDVFMPMMLGYMMGSAMSTPAPLYYGPGSYRERERRGNGYQAPIYTSGRGYSRSAPIGTAPYNVRASGSGVSTKGSLKSSTAMTPPSSIRGGFGNSFKPTNTFKSTVDPLSAAGNRSTISSGSGSRSSISSGSGSSFKSSPSVSSRGGFGGMGRSFGGGFGG
jgi:uncharacterized protein YgiB involved in biofilm formation